MRPDQCPGKDRDDRRARQRTLLAVLHKLPRLLASAHSCAVQGDQMRAEPNLSHELCRRPGAVEPVWVRCVGVPADRAAAHSRWSGNHHQRARTVRTGAKPVADCDLPRGVFPRRSLCLLAGGAVPIQPARGAAMLPATVPSRRGQRAHAIFQRAAVAHFHAVHGQPQGKLVPAMDGRQGNQPGLHGACRLGDPAPGSKSGATCPRGHHRGTLPVPRRRRQRSIRHRRGRWQLRTPHVP